ncbi:MAG: GNAT family N-acetyltransferase [Micrococcales bacterium]|nr:GNAT family N-acetyltransferase [Micrococcales bacterium]
MIADVDAENVGDDLEARFVGRTRREAAKRLQGVGVYPEADLFGELDWPPAATGAERAAEAGFLLVAVDGDQVVGFAHVLDLGGPWHLEQLSVDPAHQGRGHGTALLAAAG